MSTSQLKPDNRAQFESWWETQKPNYFKGRYEPFKRVDWEAWQASRASIVVGLPDKVMVEDEFDNGHNCVIDYCSAAIRAAGITVKGDSE
jgi:hypothetical protein